MTNQTKAQLQAEIEVLKSQIAELTAKKSERKFNIFTNTYQAIVKGFVNSGESQEFTFTVRRLDDAKFTDKEGKEVKLDGARKVIKFLYKKGALKLLGISETFDENGKAMYEIKIKDFNINTELPGKFGTYKVFERFYGKEKMKTLA